MSENLTKEQQATWDRLNYVPMFPGPHTFNFDVNSMYMHGITRREPKEGELVTIKVLKNR